MARLISPPRTSWRDDFPEVVAHAEYQVMRNHSAYTSAKSGDSNEAALSLVYDMISDDATDRLREILQGQDVRVVAVHAEETTGRNKIPVAYSEALAHLLDVPTDPGIIQASVANHGGAPSVYHRMVSQPAFDGYVETGARYLIVDDTCTVGGTLANLKGFIEANGGSVVAMSVLARQNVQQPYYISLASTTLAQLRYKHRSLDAFWNEEFGYGIEALTEGEAGHLRAAPSFDTIRNRLSEARRDLHISGDEGVDCAETATPDEGDDEANGRSSYEVGS